ncbi:MAG: hypothetical protein HY920_02995 [Elusimicrobia bacterium]|nr:hypothetical protein [Elusimicrobiota bacterium]
MNKNNLPKQLSLREAAFWICKKELINYIDDDVAQVLEWLTTAVNHNVLKACYESRCNYRGCRISATIENVNEIYIMPTDLLTYLERLLDWLLGENFLKRPVKEDLAFKPPIQLSDTSYDSDYKPITAGILKMRF